MYNVSNINYAHLHSNVQRMNGECTNEWGRENFDQKKLDC